MLGALAVGLLDLDHELLPRDEFPHPRGEKIQDLPGIKGIGPILGHIFRLQRVLAVGAGQEARGFQLYRTTGLARRVANPGRRRITCWAVNQRYSMQVHISPTSNSRPVLWAAVRDCAGGHTLVTRRYDGTRLQADGDAGRCGQQSWQSRSRVAGGERSCQATRRLWREGSRLHARWRGAAVDAGAEFRITMSEPLVIVGNGMAAACLCGELAQRALGRYAVALIGEEPRLAYNRVLLSSGLAGHVRAVDILLKPAAWGSGSGRTFVYGVGG